MKYTGNLNLKKPEGTDIVNIDDLNENADILDLAVAGKVDKVTGKGLSDESFTTAEKNKLAGIATGANNYTHPATHPASMITEAVDKRFMTDAERTKLAGIATGANNYTHPANHPASIISQDASNRFVTDTEKANWNAKETPAGAQTKVDTHANNTTTAHGATSAATANKMIIRDAAGRAKVAAPSAADDIARKDTVDAVQANLSTHLADYATTQDLTYYVNAATGNDANNGLASGNAFKTIMAAVNKLPKIINHTVVINIAPGTYSETIILNGYVGRGMLKIQGANVLSQSNSYNVLAFQLANSAITVLLIGINFTSTATNNITACMDAQILECSMTTITDSNGILTASANVSITNCNISNKQMAIAAHRNSKVMSGSNSGNGNTYSLTAYGNSTIGKTGTQPSGTTAEYTTGGGVIR